MKFAVGYSLFQPWPAGSRSGLTRALERAQTRRAVGLASRLGSLFSPDARLKDPLIGRLPEMPVPLFEAGSFVAGLERAGSVAAGLKGWGTFFADEEDFRRYSWTPVRSRGDRELGGIAQYELRFFVPREAYAGLDEEQLSQLTEVTQVVVLLNDADAAARWLMTKTRRFEDLQGQEVGGDLYRKVDVDITVTGLGEEAAVVVAHSEVAHSELPGGNPSFDTYINFRTGRLFGSVGASTSKELEVLPRLRELAEALLARMESILAGRPVEVRPVARSSWRDRIMEGIVSFAVVVGWPSAVVLICAHVWGSLFISNVARDALRAIVLIVGGFTAFVAAGMVLGPLADEERISGSSLLLLLAIAFGPTIVLALFFYGYV